VLLDLFGSCSLGWSSAERLPVVGLESSVAPGGTTEQGYAPGSTTGQGYVSKGCTPMGCWVDELPTVVFSSLDSTGGGNGGDLGRLRGASLSERVGWELPTPGSTCSGGVKRSRETPALFGLSYERGDGSGTSLNDRPLLTGPKPSVNVGGGLALMYSNASILNLSASSLGGGGGA
jgi:hypothetical protein